MNALPLVSVVVPNYNYKRDTSIYEFRVFCNRPIRISN